MATEHTDKMQKQDTTDKTDKIDEIEEWKLYMYLLKCAIRGDKPVVEELEKYRHIESGLLLKRAKSNRQGFLMYDYILEYAKHYGEEIEGCNKLALSIRGYEQYKCIRRLLELAHENEIPFIIFKGCVLAGLYPNYIQRTSCDTDIFTYRQYRQQAIDLIMKEGYRIDEGESKNEVCVLVNEQHSHKIELHTCLWEDYTGRRLDLLESLNLTDKESLIEIETCGFKVTTLGYEQHLIYQIFHIIKHFSLEGISVKYMADISLYVDAYGKYIDFDDLWAKLEKLGYAKFAHYLFAVCIQFLGMKGDIIADRKMEMGDELLEFMLDLFNVGAKGGDRRDNWQILGMMTPYFTGEKTASKSKWKRKLAVIFPRPKDLQDHHGYARRHPILLPVAWVHRIVKYIYLYVHDTKRTYSATEKLDKAEHRIDLMDKLGLLE